MTATGPCISFRNLGDRDVGRGGFVMGGVL